MKTALLSSLTLALLLIIELAWTLPLGGSPSQPLLDTTRTHGGEAASKSTFLAKQYRGMKEFGHGIREYSHFVGKDVVGPKGSFGVLITPLLALPLAVASTADFIRGRRTEKKDTPGLSLKGASERISKRRGW